MFLPQRDAAGAADGTERLGLSTGLKIQKCSGLMRCFLGPACCDENRRLMWRDDEDRALCHVRQIDAVDDVSGFPHEL